MKLLFLLFLFIPGSIYSQQDSTGVIAVSIKDTTFVNDSSLVDSTSLVKSKVDSVIILNEKSFSDNSFFIYSKDITFNDYRYAGDFLRIFPLTFIKDLGFIGQDNEVYLYGVPSSAATYMNDGIYFNNRFTLQTDLNHIQTESVDSIEVINLPRGFLYGAELNPVAINFIEKDIYSKQPFTRIKYYEGPFGEAFVDGKFSINTFKRINISADVSNKKVDNRYVNSDFSLWRAGIKAKYFLSNSINLIGSYYHIKSLVGFNGGVDVDSIATYSTDINSVLYDNVLAPVKYPTRFLKSTQHHFALRTLTDFEGWGRSDIQLYYKFTLDEDYEPLSNYENKLTNKNKVIGFAAAHTLEQDFWKLNLIGNYEQQVLRNINVVPTYFSDDTINTNTISFSAIASIFLFDSSIVPSFFSRIKNQSTDANYPLTYNKNLFGFGADVSLILNNEIKLYVGISTFDQNFSEWSQMRTEEIGVQVNYDFVQTELKYFNVTNRYVQTIYPMIDYFGYNIINFMGASLNANFSLWNFSLETLTSIYKNAGTNSGANVLDVPDVTFRGGVYFKGLAFNSNLDIKTGFVFNYTGQQIITDHQFFNLSVDPSYKLDFTVAGQIQKVATVYFTWENLFDNDYFITPYYPMPNRNIRFGLSWELFN
ncbi:MAG TPA: TonB-dependent receptor plug domain-containing protein [Ignavibacteriaceae bacterium]|nr:TonB-dependent receptor plug domain-containing protein [Ignavibacteriaceae bacterium]